MSRTGFPNADIDVGILHDPKVIALHRRGQDHHATADHVMLYLALILESWSRGGRATLDEAAPAWWPEPLDPSAMALRAVGLIDDENRIVTHAWESWFGPARDRRAARQFEGSVSGLMSHDRSLTRKDAERIARLRANPEVTSGSPQGGLDPSVPTYRPAGPQAEPAVSAAGDARSGLGAASASLDTCYRCGAPFMAVVNEQLITTQSEVVVIDGSSVEVHLQCPRRHP